MTTLDFFLPGKTPAPSNSSWIYSEIWRCRWKSRLSQSAICPIKPLFSVPIKIASSCIYCQRRGNTKTFWGCLKNLLSTTTLWQMFLKFIKIGDKKLKIFWKEKIVEPTTGIFYSWLIANHQWEDCKIVPKWLIKSICVPCSLVLWNPTASFWQLRVMDDSQWGSIFIVQEVGSIIGKKGDIVKRFREEVKKTTYVS